MRMIAITMRSGTIRMLARIRPTSALDRSGALVTLGESVEGTGAGVAISCGSKLALGSRSGNGSERKLCWSGPI